MREDHSRDCLAKFNLDGKIEKEELKLWLSNKILRVIDHFSKKISLCVINGRKRQPLLPNIHLWIISDNFILISMIKNNI